MMSMPFWHVSPCSTAWWLQTEEPQTLYPKHLAVWSSEPLVDTVSGLPCSFIAPHPQTRLAVQVSAIDYCAREPVGKLQCSQIQARVLCMLRP